MSLCQPFSGDQTTDEQLVTKDVKTIRLLNTLYTASQWMEVLEMESVVLKLGTQYSVQKPALTTLICTILGETHLVTNGSVKAIVLDERDLELYEGNGDIRGQMITFHWQMITLHCRLHRSKHNHTECMMSCCVMFCLS